MGQLKILVITDQNEVDHLDLHGWIDVQDGETIMVKDLSDERLEKQAKEYEG